MDGCRYSNICQSFHAVINPAFRNVGSCLHGYHSIRISCHAYGGCHNTRRVGHFLLSVGCASGTTVTGHCDTTVICNSHGQSTPYRTTDACQFFCVVFFSAIVSPSFLSDIFHRVVSSLFRFCGYMVYQFMDVEHIAAGEDSGDTALQILSHYRSSGLAVHIRS